MLRLEDIMSAPLVTVTPELPLREAAELLVARHLSGAPVVCGTRVVGVITAGDILGFQAAQGDGRRRESPDDDEPDEGADLWSLALDAERAFPWDDWSEDDVALVERLADRPLDDDALLGQTVSDAMTHNVLSLPAATPLRVGAAFIARHRIHRVLVERDGEIVGLVSTSDLARVVAERGVAGDA